MNGLSLLRVLLALALAAAACTGGEAGPEDDVGINAPADDELPDEVVPDVVGDELTAGEVVEEGALADDVRFVELAPPEDFGPVTVTVGPDDVSLLFIARGADIDDEVYIDEITGPDGERYDAPLELQPSNFGETAVLLPLFADQPLVPGEYTFFVGSDAGLTEVGAVLKQGPLPAEQVIDVTFHVASVVFAEASQAEREELALVYRNAGDTILGAHGLAVGDLSFVDTSEEVIDAYGEIELPSSGNDSAQRELCRALDQGEDVNRRLAFAIVDYVIDPEDDTGETEGNAAGLPGATLVPDAATSCVLMIADGSRDVTELAATVWHEAGHLLGLPHTTEFEGDSFDIFDDTPECDAAQFDADGSGDVDQFECPDGDNLMFHDSDTLAISDQQAFVLRHHPLFHAGP